MKTGLDQALNERLAACARVVSVHDAAGELHMIFVPLNESQVIRTRDELAPGTVMLLWYNGKPTCVFAAPDAGKAVGA
jgi:hypothetical protein